MNRILVLLFCMIFSSMGLITHAQTGETNFVISEKNEIPEIFPSYFNSFFKNHGLVYVEGISTNQMIRSNFSTEDESVRLEVTTLKCDASQQKKIFRNIIGSISHMADLNSGFLLEISDVDLSAVLFPPEDDPQQVFGFVLQSSVQIWHFIGDLNATDLSNEILPLVNRQRYLEALKAGNVSMGHWGDQIHDYASWLIENGESKKAVLVLKNHLKTMAFDYEAHVDFFSHTSDLIAASNSAEIVYRNAEDQELIEKAASFLGKRKLLLDDFPVLEPGEKGMQLILLPLPPCNPWLLEDSAKLFEEITGVPTKICRLGMEWKWEAPDRVARQRDIQEMLVGKSEKPIDFDGWSKDRYIEELQKLTDEDSVISKYYINKMIETVRDEPGQYSVSSYLSRLSDLLAKVRSDDFRTMYVGITEANIYSGDNRYVFSNGYARGDSRASVFSYYMMRAETFNDTPSRARLVERIGKELCPAALKQLGIERSSDPSCPYSYANGVDRLDQKTRNLAEPVAKALVRMKYLKTP